MPDGIWIHQCRDPALARQNKGRVAGSALQLVPATVGGAIVPRSQRPREHISAPQGVDDVDIEVRRAAFTPLIGPNGSGKTTTLNVLSGGIRPAAGRVILDGTDVTEMPPHQRSAAGLGEHSEHRCSVR